MDGRDGETRPEEKSPSRHASERANQLHPPYLLQRAFTERLHELTTLDRLLRNDLLVDLADRKKYAFELSNYHRVPAEALAGHLHSSLTAGLTSDVAATRLHEDGRNVITPPKMLPLWVRFLLCFVSGFAPLLWFAAGVVFLSWKPFGSGTSAQYNLVLACVLLGVIFISGIFQFHQEVVTSKALSGFATLIPPTCIVLRNGVPTRVAADMLVVGDVVTVESGGRIPADMRMFEASRLRVDKSLLTGESEPVLITTSEAPKDAVFLESSNMVFTGCCATEGQGKGLVIATGAESQLAKISQASSDKGAGKQTSLQKEITRFVFIIACFAALTAAIVIVWWATWLNKKHPGFMNSSALIANAISVLVAFVPEGLPLALCMGLAIIARRLCAAHGVLLKKMGTVETLGSMSLLASDKTGTLTQNKMTVVQLIAVDAALNVRATDASVHFDASGAAFVGCDGEHQLASSPLLQAAMSVAALCNQAQIEKSVHSRSRASTGDDSTPGEGFNNGANDNDLEAPAADTEETPMTTNVKIVGGNGIDKALLSWACAAGAAETLRGSYKVETVVPFSSKTKTAAAVVRRGDEPAVLLTKGAPEYVVAACSTALDGFGNIVPLTPEMAQEIAEMVEGAASQGQRIVGLARRELSLAAYPVDFKFSSDPSPNFETGELQFVCCVAVSDPPRVGVQEAVNELRTAGIKIAMVTGDAPSTALAIARQTGLVSAPPAEAVDTLDAFLKPDKEPVSQGAKISSMFTASSRRQPLPSTAKASRDAVLVVGPELEGLSAAGWDFVFAHKEMCFSRTTPEQKLLIVKEAQGRGQRVGVTGDGVNDAPALRRSDVGVAMYSGADSAKDAAAIVLLNDDFAAIVHAVREGRLIFANLRRVIAYQISAGCWAELLPVLATFFLGLPQPLSTLMMILISCITDVFAGVALMNEKAETAIMRERPRDFKKDHLVDAKLVSYAYLFYANLVSLGCFINYFQYMRRRGPLGIVPDPIPADGSGFTASDFPAGYTTSQLFFAWNWGLADGPLGDDAVNAANSGSAVYFVTIVVGQMLHLLSVRRKTPYFALPPAGGYRSGGRAGRLGEALKENAPPLRIVAAWCGSIAVALFLTEIPAVRSLCGTGSVPALNWGIAFGWSALCFLIAEGRKWLIYSYPDSCIGKTAW